MNTNIDLTMVLNILMLGISFIAMVATVWSCVIAVKARDESKKANNEANQAKQETEKMLQEIKVIMVNVQNNKVENRIGKTGNVDVKNEGENIGVVAGVITGGVTQGDRR